ncbi:MAG: hypothetical protein CSA07_04360 [Bacteroidia bacterium]|nr:MAG: hypothetical protein CSA07_04360 [Bacteroidia bacterium]
MLAHVAFADLWSSWVARKGNLPPPELGNFKPIYFTFSLRMAWGYLALCIVGSLFGIAEWQQAGMGSLRAMWLKLFGQFSNLMFP